MPDYFASNAGSDSTGTGTAANPWKTIGKAIGSSPAITLPGSGTTRLVLGGGDVFREAVTLGLSPGSANPLEVVGDLDGSLFSAAGGTGQTGLTRWVAWSDATTTLADPCLTISNKGYVAVSRIRFVGGSHTNNVFSLTNATAVEFADCEFAVGSPSAVSANIGYVSMTSAAGSGLRVRRCDFEVSAGGSSRAMYIFSARDDSSYDADLRVENCRLRGGSRTIEFATGGGGKLTGATGMAIECCTFQGAAAAVYVALAPDSAGAVTVTGCVIAGASTGLYAATSGQIVEDYNLINAVTPRNNTAAGANSVAGFEPTMNLETWRLTGAAARPYMEPSAGSLLLGFLPRPSGLLTDLHGRSRPDPCAAGCLERVDPPVPPSGATYIFQVEG